MNEYRMRPKDSYLQNSQWQELYVLTEHWKSDLLFYKDDLKFLHHLLDKYFIWITKTENLKAVQTIGQNILAKILWPVIHYWTNWKDIWRNLQALSMIPQSSIPRYFVTIMRNWKMRLPNLLKVCAKIERNFLR